MRWCPHCNRPTGLVGF